MHTIHIICLACLRYVTSSTKESFIILHSRILSHRHGSHKHGIHPYVRDAIYATVTQDNA